MLVSFDNVSFSYGGEQIIENVSLGINKGDKIALIGPNGAGKTTLLNLISGKLIEDSGTITRAPYLRVGYLKQTGDVKNNGTIQSEMEDALKDVYEAKKELDDLSKKLSVITSHDSQEYKDTEALYQKAEEKFISLDGYSAEVRINTVLTGMGFGTFPRDTSVAKMSGGEQTRLMLCKLLLEDLDILILDEATNHLDFTMLAWLEEYLTSYKGTILTVSHDRWFLNNVTKTTWEIEGLNIVSYSAPYNEYLNLRKMRLERMEKEYEKYCNTVQSLQEYADKNMARASTSQSAKSRLRMIEHMDKVEKPPKIEIPPKFEFKGKVRPVSDILHVEHLDVMIREEDREKLLIKDFGIHVKRGDKVAIIGSNGTGKSTLLKILTENMPKYNGIIDWGRNTKIAYFHQDAGELHPYKTILMELWDRYPLTSELHLRNLLAQVGFRGEEVYKEVRALSGGETARLKLAILMEQDANVLLLDEPTNHLDMPSKEALEEALIAYDGTLIVVSHDRWLLSHVPSRIVYFNDGKYDLYNMNFKQLSEEVLSKPKTSAVKEEEKGESVKKEVYHKSKAQRALTASLKNKEKKLLADIEELEALKMTLEESLSSPDIVSDYQKVNEISEEMAQTDDKINELYEQLDEVMTELDS